jgi:sugar fermentation stimulation protein A
MVQGTLIRRHMRFLADIQLDDGSRVTAHTPNTGSMKTCSEPGRPVWLSHHPDPGRKLAYSWEIIEMEPSWVGINTMVPNRLTKTAAAAGRIPDLIGYSSIRSEVKTSPNTRLDLLLEALDRPKCYVEIKNTTLVADGAARFPDAVTERGRKHLLELADLAKKGFRAVIFYLVQRMDAVRFEPADDIDPEYGRVLRRVAKEGVDILAYDVALDRRRIDIRRSLPVVL